MIYLTIVVSLGSNPNVELVRVFFSVIYTYFKQAICLIVLILESCVVFSVSTFDHSDSRASGRLFHCPFRGDQRHPFAGPRLDFPATVHVRRVIRSVRGHSDVPRALLLKNTPTKILCNSVISIRIEILFSQKHHAMSRLRRVCMQCDYNNSPKRI